MEKRKTNQSVIDLLEAAKKKQGCANENALAVRLGMDRQKLNNYKFGTKPSNENLLILCEAAEMDFTKTLTAIESEFATTEEAKKRWDNQMKRLGGVAASFMAGILLIVTMIVTSPDLQAKESRTYSAEMPVIQIMRDFRRVIEAARRIARMLVLRVYCWCSPNTGITA